MKRKHSVSPDQTHSKLTAPKLSAIATACALAFTSTAYAQSNGIVVSATNLLNSDVTQTLDAFGYEMRLLSAQNNSAGIAAEVLSNTLTASFASGPDAALTISGNSVSAATLGNQATNSADLGLLGSGINPFAIAAANSQLRNTGASTATVDNQLIEARSVDSQFAPTTISGNSVSASVGLNNASTRVAGTPARAFNSEEPVGTTLANDATLVIASANIAVVNAQTASNASGNAGSRAAVTQSTIVASATGAPADGSNALSEAVTISNNAIAAGFASNTATTVYQSTPGLSCLQGRRDRRQRSDRYRNRTADRGSNRPDSERKHHRRCATAGRHQCARRTGHDLGQPDGRVILRKQSRRTRRNRSCARRQCPDHRISQLGVV